MVGFAGETANLAVVLKLDDSGFSGKLSRASGQVSGFGRSLSRMGTGVGQVGSGLARLGTRAAIAAGGGLAAVVTTAASMEEAFIGVQKTVDETANVSFDELRDVIRKMSSETGTAFEELSRIGEIGGALGVPIESLDEFIDVVNRLGVSTDLSVDDAATALGHLGTVLHLSGEDFRDAADGLVALGNAGASSEGQIVAIAERFAVAGSRAGLTTSEILALGSTVASMGIEVEAGGTALSNTFNQIAVAIGTGGKEVEAFTDLLGVSAAEFRRRWETDALGTFQEFLHELDKLPPIEQAVALEAAGITGARQQAAIGALSDGYAELGRQLGVVEDREGALNEESDKFYASTSNAFRKLRENVRLSASAIGNELLPITNELITDFVGELNKPSTQAGIKAFAQDLAGGIRGFVDELKGTDFSGLLSGMKFAADAAKLAFNAFRSLPPDIQAILVGAFALNKVSGGAISQLVKGVTNIALGGGGLAGAFLGRGSLTNPMFVTVTNPAIGGGGPGGGAIPVPTGGWRAFLTGAMKLIPIVGLEILLGEFASQFTREINPSQFDFNQVAGQSGNFNTQQQAEAFAVATANRLGVPLDELKAGIVTGVTGGMTFDQAVAAFIVAVNDPKSQKPEGPPDLRQLPEWVRKLRVEGFASLFPKKIPDTALPRPDTAALPNTAMTALTNTPVEIRRLAPILSKQDQTLQTLRRSMGEQKMATSQGLAAVRGAIAAKDTTATVTANLTVNTFISGTMFAKQQSVVHVAAGRYAGKPVPLS